VTRFLHKSGRVKDQNRCVLRDTRRIGPLPISVLLGHLRVFAHHRRGEESNFTARFECSQITCNPFRPEERWTSAFVAELLPCFGALLDDFVSAKNNLCRNFRRCKSLYRKLPFSIPTFESTPRCNEASIRFSAPAVGCSRPEEPDIRVAYTTHVHF
jgi:hypothetical protein